MTASSSCFGIDKWVENQIIAALVGCQSEFSVSALQGRLVQNADALGEEAHCFTSYVAPTGRGWRFHCSLASERLIFPNYQLDTIRI